MSKERSKILKMVADGKITTDEAERLLDAIVDTVSVKEETTEKKNLPEFMYVKVVSADNDNVDVKVPINLIRAGIRLTNLIPQNARKQINESLEQHGMSIDFDNLKKEDIEVLIESLSDMEINVNSKNGDTVKVYCA